MFFFIFLLLFNFQCHLDHCVVTLILIVPTPLVAQSDKTNLKHPDRLVVVIMKWLIFVRAIGARRDTIQCLKAAPNVSFDLPVLGFHGVALDWSVIFKIVAICMFQI